ncbi:hypothetical protein [Arcticibacter eurypsychrophilus]|uniref:hypothetical protein n=1 Tax=Arcticibacter eurypsychrophilus TaxID=1434752 RepID=UPI00084DBD09|nr:hypothetical protein [Arcticibacter eurypsychrophilus]
MREFSLEQSTSLAYDWLIKGKVTGIVIAVYFGSDSFQADDQEVQYYVSTNEMTIYFQTINYGHQKLNYLIAGIYWFISQKFDSTLVVQRY